MLKKLKTWARNLKKQLKILYYCYKDDRVPVHVKIMAACVLAYAFSPVDLIPDFIPILGLLDDIILVPLGIAFVIRLIPKSIYEEYQAKITDGFWKDRPKNWITGGVIIALWLLVIGYVLYRVTSGLLYNP